MHPAPLDDRAGGFYTREVRARAAGRRTGFELTTLAERMALLATRDPDADLHCAAPFGRYRADLDAIDAAGVPALLDALDRGQAVVVDEIGPMEIRSPRFRDAILQILEAEAAVVGTIVLRPQSFCRPGQGPPQGDRPDDCSRHPGRPSRTDPLGTWPAAVCLVRSQATTIEPKSALGERDEEKDCLDVG